MMMIVMVVVLFDTAAQSRLVIHGPSCGNAMVTESTSLDWLALVIAMLAGIIYLHSSTTTNS